MPMINSHRPINIPKYIGFDTKFPTIIYKIPIMIAIYPFQLLSVVSTIIIPAISRNKPTINTIKPAMKANSAGFTMIPIPRTNAINQILIL